MIGASSSETTVNLETDYWGWAWLLHVRMSTLLRYTMLNGLVIADPIQFKAKLAQFAASGANGLYALFEFDRTLTTKRPGTQDDVTTWHILREHLPEDGQKKYQTLFERYRPLELSGNMKPQDAAAWWSSILDLFVQYAIQIPVP